MKLKQRWQSYLKNNQRLDTGLFNPIFLEKYSEPYRKYHNLNHISYCLDLLDILVPSDIQKDKIELAIWFHDVIYNTQAFSNEHLSVILMKSCLLGSTCWPVEYLNEVGEMIMATKHDSNLTSSSPDHFKYFIDIDLAILGETQEEFDNYNAQIKEEYNWVPEETYKTKRVEILQSFLNREWIYNTQLFRNEFEEPARQNLKRAIKELI